MLAASLAKYLDAKRFDCFLQVGLLQNKMGKESQISGGLDNLLMIGLHNKRVVRQPQW